RELGRYGVRSVRLHPGSPVGFGRMDRAVPAERQYRRVTETLGKLWREFHRIREIVVQYQEVAAPLVAGCDGVDRVDGVVQPPHIDRKRLRPEVVEHFRVGLVIRTGLAGRAEPGVGRGQFRREQVDVRHVVVHRLGELGPETQGTRKTDGVLPVGRPRERRTEFADPDGYVAPRTGRRDGGARRGDPDGDARRPLDRLIEVEETTVAGAEPTSWILMERDRLDQVPGDVEHA